MNDLGLIGLVVAIAGWIISVGFAGEIAAQKQSRGSGILLGILFGPLGMIAAGFLDGRPYCPQCGSRINSSPSRQFPICPSCRHEFPVVAQSQSESALNMWELELERSKEKLAAAGLIELVTAE
jgi:hypothetical protein